MLVLDENLPAGQRLLLRRWGIRFRLVGVDVASWGTHDENLIPVLHRLPSNSHFDRALVPGPAKAGTPNAACRSFGSSESRLQAVRGQNENCCRLPQPTFFSLDRDFHRPDWAHASYGLVWLEVADDRAAEFIRRFLRHPSFNTQAKRMGLVVRVHASGVICERTGRRSPQSSPWPHS